MWYRRLEVLLAGLLCLAVMPAVASASERSQANEQAPYEIMANRAVFDQKTAKGVYYGDVELKRGSQLISAGKIVLKLNKNRQLRHAVATGSPVTFTDGKAIHGQADKLVYDVATHTIELFGDAHVQQGERQFSGNHITYAMDSQRIKAEGGENGRVHIVLPPEDTTGGNTP